MTVYCAAILDVVGSKASPDRAGLQSRIEDAVGEFNTVFRPFLPVSAGVTVGDEWEFLTDQPGRGYEMVRWFQEILRPHRIAIYAGLGIGALNTPPAAEIGRMDGPCFHLARRALKIAKGEQGGRHEFICSKRNRVYLLAETAGGTNRRILAFHDPEAAAATEDGLGRLSLLEIANALIENTEILKARMSEKQRTAALEYRRLGSYRKMAGESPYRQTPGGISQKLNTADYFTIRRNERLIGVLLDAMAKGWTTA
ncbi:MAG: SatD family protein [Bacteroidota bacterium]